MARGPVLSAVVRRPRARTTAEQKLPLPQGKGHQVVFQRDRAVGTVDRPALFPITPRGRFVSAGLFLENTPEEGRLTLAIKAMLLPRADGRVLGSGHKRHPVELGAGPGCGACARSLAGWALSAGERSCQAGETEWTTAPHHVALCGS